MEFINVIQHRSSVRSYSEREVEDDKITYVLEAAQLAPSWANKQCWRFIVIKNKETIERISKTSIINRWLKSVPTIICACADPTESGTNNTMEYYLVDAAIAFDHLILAATDQGLGTCWIGGFDEEKVKELLGIPKRIRVIALTPLGYPANTTTLLDTTFKMVTRGKKRKSLKEIVHYEKW